MNMNRNRRLRVCLATVVMAFVGAACTAGPKGTAESDAPIERVSESAATPDKANGLAPVAVVLYSGRIAFPNITLTTWGTCPFVINRVERVKVGVLRVIGQESSTDCSQKVKQHIVSKRLPVGLKAGSEFEKQVIVVSTQPEYEIKAVVQQAIA